MGSVLDKTPLSDEAKPAIIEAVEGKYRHVLLLIAKHFCGAADVAAAKIIELGEASFVLRYWDSKDHWEERSLGYQNAAGETLAAATAEDLRRIFVGMARVASEATGDELALPPAAFIDYRESAKAPGAYCLNDLINSDNMECLNQDDDHPLASAIGKAQAGAADEPMGAAGLQSDPGVDHQLLIKLRFLQPVKLKAITFAGNPDDETGPKGIKIFHGRMNLDFSEADEAEAIQTVDLTAEQVRGGDPIMLRFVKFQHVTDLQLFVQSNFGAETTRIEQLELWGIPVETVDMKAWKPLHGDVSNPVRGIVEPQVDEPSGI